MLFVVMEAPIPHNYTSLLLQVKDFKLRMGTGMFLSSKNGLPGRE